MKLLPILIGVSALLSPQEGTVGTEPQPRLRQWHPLPVPPPPLANYDPQPGAFIVALNDAGQVGREYFGVIANAVRAWSGPKLQAFMICFRSQRESLDRDVAVQALDAVARELKARNARVVVMPSGRLCGSPYAGSRQLGPHVEIMGVVRF